jgi:undecaprenyl diphosphate synthase
VDSVRDTVRGCPDLGVTTLTLYAFSSDNWKRPAAEVGRLFWLLREYCARERDELVANGVRVTAIGRRDRLPRSARAALEQLERDSAGGGRLHVRLAIDYSGQWMIAEAARRLAQEGASATPEALERALTAGVPQVDLLVRTAGEQRLSDFLLWEVAYAELYFTKVLWPDFRRDHLALALAEFRRRERRFGGLVPVVTDEPVPALRVAAG